MKKLVCLLLATCTILAIQAQNTTNIGENFQSYFDTLAISKKFSGTLLVASKGETIFCSTSVLDNSISDEHGIYPIWGLSQMFTSLLVFEAAEEGLLDLSDKVGTTLEGVSGGDIIAISNLLNHSSGYFNIIFDYEWSSRAFNIDDIVTYLREKPLLMEPGIQFKHSDSNPIALASILELVRRKSFKAILTERLFDRYGLDDSGSGASFFQKPNVIRGAKLPDFPQRWFSKPIFEPVAGIYSSAHDLGKIGNLIISGRLLKETTITSISNSPLNDIRGSRVGLGFNLPKTSNRILYNTGRESSYAHILFIDLNKQLVIVVLADYLGILPSGQLTPESIVSDVYRLLGFDDPLR